jgi:tetratricopeptide (TPR) repeat protein
MNEAEFLLSFPSPVEGIERYIAPDNTLTVSFENAAELAQHYYESVALHLRSTAPRVDEDVIPALSFALRLFNAENFSGELTPAERTHFALVLQHFGGVVEKGYVGPDEVENVAVSKKEENEEVTTEAAAATTAAAKPASTSVATAATTTTPAEERAKLCDLFLQRLLTTDGEMPVAAMRLPGLLLCVLGIAKAEVEPGVPLLPFTSLWRLRSFFRHQLCLSRRSNTVFLAIADCVDAMMRQPEEEQTVEMLLEVGHVQSYYHRRELAKETFDKAMRLSGLVLEETSMMGVRTRWQQHQLVQMVLNAKSSRAVPPSSTEEEQPKTVMAEKDGHDLLDRPRESPEAAAQTLTPLHPEDKAILLALCMDIRNNNPDYGFTQHHMMIYIERLLADPAPSPFMVRCQTLLMRSRLEARRNRVQERAFMQLMELVDQYSARRDPTHETFGRTDSPYYYSVAFPPVWALKREYADFCYDETLFKTALDVYEQILDWEKIIECCKKLDKRRRAESLARELLEKDPQNPMLWVALGEATRNDVHLWKAWELCGHKMAAPMRALARLALDREHFDKVVEYFDEAVRINPVFGGDWFTLGYASLRLKNFQRSGEAFTRVCQIDPNDAFGWNNLASIMLRERKLRPAFNAMSQAIRNNRRDWRMWQNYFRIGCELKEVTETTNALRIALDIAQRHIQLERGTLELFVDNTIAYLKGEIGGTSADAEETQGAKADALVYRSLGVLPTEDDIQHAPVAQSFATAVADGGEETEGEEELVADLMPFGADVEDEEETDGLHPAAAAAGETAEHAAVVEGIRRRHADRVRALFVTIFGLFVSDPDLYACAAKLFHFLDGPMESFRYHQKELRACQQKDQWSRNDTLFTRTVDTLEGMSQDLFEAFAMAQEGDAAHLPYAQTASPPTTAATAAATDQTGEGDAGGAAVPPPSGPPPTTAPAPAPRRGEALQQAVVGGFKDLQTNIKGALDASEEHMVEHPSYKRLRELATRVRRGVQEVKAAFV